MEPDKPRAVRRLNRKRNPDWSWDEAILLLDLYRRVQTAEAEHGEVIALSHRVNAAARGAGVEPDPTFRNPAGVAMRLRNLAHLDQAYLAKQKRGLKGPNRTDREVWGRFASDPQLLPAEVERVRRAWSLSARPEDGSASLLATVSRGPAPAFGVVTASYEDDGSELYLFQLVGAVQAIFPGHDLGPGRIVAKIGRSNDLTRRCEELNAGIPPGANLRWLALRTVKFTSTLTAHTAEQRLLQIVQTKGWAIGGEFAIAPASDLVAELRRMASDHG